MEAYRSPILSAIRQASEEVRWKAGKALPHLEKRILKGHLHSNATLETYHDVIVTVMTHPEAQLYLYTFQESLYPTIVAPIADQHWLVMIGMDGVMETAFPPDDPDTYLSDAHFTHLGALQEWIS